MASKIIESVEKPNPGNTPVTIHAVDGAVYGLNISPLAGVKSDRSGEIADEIIAALREQLAGKVR